jgi:hypothetical protein
MKLSAAPSRLGQRQRKRPAEPQDAAGPEAAATGVVDARVWLRVVNAARQEVKRLERERYETAARPAAEGGGCGDAAGER